jgi:hypothetical protein
MPPAQPTRCRLFLVGKLADQKQALLIMAEISTR